MYLISEGYIYIYIYNEMNAIAGVVCAKVERKQVKKKYKYTSLWHSQLWLTNWERESERVREQIR